MKKSVYSLMLFDEIVEQIDQLAEKENSNRSQLINDILAQYLGLTTPEQKIQKILENLDENLKDELDVNQITKNTSIHFNKNIEFKYKPRIKYIYEFIGTGDKKFAVLKISSRSKSKVLDELFNEFFKKLSELEQKNSYHLGIKPEDEKKFKFVREFRIESSITRDIDEITNFLSNYLKMLNEAMNIFFSEENKNCDEKLQKVFDQFFLSKQLQIKTENPLDLIRIK